MLRCLGPIALAVVDLGLPQLGRGKLHQLGGRGFGHRSPWTDRGASHTKQEGRLVESPLLLCHPAMSISRPDFLGQRLVIHSSDRNTLLASAIRPQLSQRCKASPSPFHLRRQPRVGIPPDLKEPAVVAFRLHTLPLLRLNLGLAQLGRS